MTAYPAVFLCTRLNVFAHWACERKPDLHSIQIMSRQQWAGARANNRRRLVHLLGCGSSVCAEPQGSWSMARKQRATNRGIGVLQTSARTAFTWRAPSSPHHACGLNGSFFLQPCGPLSAAQAGCLLGVLEGAEPCGTLRGWMLYAALKSTHERLKLVGASGKRLVF